MEEAAGLRLQITKPQAGTEKGIERSSLVYLTEVYLVALTDSWSRPLNGGCVAHLNQPELSLGEEPY